MTQTAELMAKKLPNTKESVKYRTIERFPGYRFGSDGTVWTCWKKVRSGVGRAFESIESQTWRLMRPWVTRNGYMQIILKAKVGKRKHHSIHRLVLEAFRGECPGGMEGCHYDGDKKNNCLENLRWETKTANAMDRDRHGTTARGASHGNSKLTPELVQEIRAAYDSIPVVSTLKPAGTLIELSERFGIPKSTIRKITRRESWRHV